MIQRTICIEDLFCLNILLRIIMYNLNNFLIIKVNNSKLIIYEHVSPYLVLLTIL